jgi:hypothetical protein
VTDGAEESGAGAVFGPGSSGETAYAAGLARSLSRQAAIDIAILTADLPTDTEP